MTTMNVGLYQAAAALDVNSRWQEMVAENLASSSLPGYKRQELTQAAVQAGLMPAGSQSKRGAPQAFVIPQANTAINFQPGQMKATGGATDVAIDGKGFFSVELPTGQTLFTRDGEFHVNAAGGLVTNEGYAVMGQSGAIQLDKSNHGPVSISSTGQVSQGANLKGKLKLTDFDNPNLLTQAAGSYFMANDPNIRQIATTATVRSGYIEGSNVSTISQMTSLLSAMRGYETNQKVIQMENDRMSHSIADLGNPT